VAGAVDAGELCGLRLGQPRLRAAEATPPRLDAQPLEDAANRRRVAVAKRTDDDAVDIA
jgi:hypothetical protein